MSNNTGLSNQAQALFLLAALVLIGVGGVVASVPSQIPSPLREYIGLALIVCGAIGAAIKEWLGIPSTPTTNTPTPQPQPATHTAVSLPGSVLRAKNRLAFLALRM